MRDIKTVIIVLIAICLAVEVFKHFERDQGRRRVLLKLVFLLYLCGVGYFVCFRGNRTDLGGVSVRFPGPFLKALMRESFGTVARRSLLNILLFVPFGYLLPQVKPFRWFQIVGFGFLLSFLIESSQFVFRFGVFELDDLVKNTMGAGLGFWLYALLDRLHRKK